MRNYIILNGVNSNTINGLLIQELSPISKPKIRTNIEEIDGRDGDITTKLGYSAYDKTVRIGLHGSFDINAIISYFNSEGTVVFSNESDKYYKYEIIDQIDFERLVRYRTADVLFHCQPFKYSTTEQKQEFNATEVSGSGSNITLNNTENGASFTNLQIKGDTEQTTYSGKQLLNLADGSGTPNGLTYSYSKNHAVISGTPTTSFNVQLSSSTITLSAGTYTLSGCPSGGGWNNHSILLIDTSDSSISYMDTGSGKNFTLTESHTFRLWFRVGANIVNTSLNFDFYTMLETGSTVSPYEPYVGGTPSPNPDYPQEVKTVTGENTINVVGRNLFNNDLPVNNSWINGQGQITTLTGGLIEKIKCKAGQDYTLKLDWENSHSTNNGCIMVFYDKDNNMLSRNPSSTTTTTLTITKTAPVNSDYMYVGHYIAKPKTVMLEKSSTASTYEPYQSQSYEINLGKQLFDMDKITGFINGSLSDDVIASTSISSNYGGVSANIGNFSLSAGTYYLSAKIKLASGTSSVTMNTIAITGTPSVTISWNTRPNLSSDYQLYLISFTLTQTTNITNILFQLGTGNSSAVLNIKEIMISKSKDTTYAPYFTPIELCKIRDYQDYLYKEVGKWYKYGAVEKFILDKANQSSGINYCAVNTVWDAENPGFVHFQFPMFNVKHNDGDKIMIVDNRLQSVDIAHRNLRAEQIFAHYSNGVVSITILMSRLDGISESSTSVEKITAFNLWLQNNNLVIYFVKETPTITEITNETLITQLDALLSATTYLGQTNIVTSGVEINPILDVSTYAMANSNFTITNNGNIKSKPIITVKGIGTIGLYYDGNQVISLNMGNTENQMTIDVANMEAYNKETGALMNRNVIGNYNNLALNVGSNVITESGTLTGFEIENYSRWL